MKAGKILETKVKELIVPFDGCRKLINPVPVILKTYIGYNYDKKEHEYIDSVFNIVEIMRYALRKQDKIKAVLGNEYLENNILQSLNKYFENSDNDRIYSDIEPDGYVTDYGNKYPLLRINDVANSDAMLEFAVMGQMYDVLNLSYVGRMKG